MARALRSFCSIVLIVVTAVAKTTKSPPIACPLPKDFNFTVNFAEDVPYATKTELFKKNDHHGIMYDYTRMAILDCFHSFKCNLKQVEWISVNASWLEKSIVEEQTDIAFAIPPSMSLAPTSGLTISTPLSSPGLAFVVDYYACTKVTERSTINSLLTATWPIFCFIVLLAGISGIFIWALESRVNQKEFPKSFARGTYEGFWWALVSMTTVGYGDKIPKSIFGRFFGAAWILVGVTVVSIFTATFTSVITVASVDNGCKGIQGKNVAVLNESQAEQQAVHLGAQVTIFEDVDSMFVALEAGNLDGILLDRFKAYYYLNKLQNDKLRVAQLLDIPLTYGVAVLDRRSNELTAKNGCIVKYLKSKHKQLDRLIKKYVSPVKPVSSATDAQLGLFSLASQTISTVLLAQLAIFLSLIFCGIMWETIHKKRLCCVKSVPRTTFVNTEDTPIEPTVRRQVEDIEEALKTLLIEVQKIKDRLHNGSTSTTCMESAENSTEQDDSLLRI